MLGPITDDHGTAIPSTTSDHAPARTVCAIPGTFPPPATTTPTSDSTAIAPAAINPATDTNALATSRFASVMLRTRFTSAGDSRAGRDAPAWPAGDSPGPASPPFARGRLSSTTAALGAPSSVSHRTSVVRTTAYTPIWQIAPRITTIPATVTHVRNCCSAGEMCGLAGIAGSLGPARPSRSRPTPPYRPSQPAR